MKGLLCVLQVIGLNMEVQDGLFERDPEGQELVNQVNEHLPSQASALFAGAVRMSLSITLVSKCSVNNVSVSFLFTQAPCQFSIPVYQHGKRVVFCRSSCSVFRESTKASMRGIPVEREPTSTTYQLEFWA